jgi:Glutamine amidotransferases class-II
MLIAAYTNCFVSVQQVGACLDRNGLRPARYLVTRDGMVCMMSETGVVPVDECDIVEKVTITAIQYTHCIVSDVCCVKYATYILHVLRSGYAACSLYSKQRHHCTHCAKRFTSTMKQRHIKGIHTCILH